MKFCDCGVCGPCIEKAHKTPKHAGLTLTANRDANIREYLANINRLGLSAIYARELLSELDALRAELEATVAANEKLMDGMAKHQEYLRRERDVLRNMAHNMSEVWISNIDIGVRECAEELKRALAASSSDPASSEEGGDDHGE